MPTQRVRAESPGALIIQVDLPAGYHLNPMAPQRYQISVAEGFSQLALTNPVATGSAAKTREVKLTAKDLKLPLRIPFAASSPGESALRIQLTLFYCREDNTGTCRIKTLVWRAPISVVKDAAAPTEVKVSGKVAAD